MATQQTLLNWNRTPNADSFNCLSEITLGPITDSAGVANTTIQAGILFPTLTKIRKVTAFYTAVDAIAGASKFNLVVGTGSYTPSVATLAPNDNSFSSGTAAPASGTTDGAGNAQTYSGVGYPTDVAAAGATVFSADVEFLATAPGTNVVGAANASTYAPGWILGATTGGYGVFVPPNYDAVYPMLVPLTLRCVTPASTGAITKLQITLLVATCTPLANPGSLNFVTPGLDF